MSTLVLIMLIPLVEVNPLTVRAQPSAVTRMSIKQDNASSGGQLTNGEDAGEHLQPSATAQVGLADDNPSVSTSVRQAYTIEAMSAKRREFGKHCLGQSVQDIGRAYVKK